MPTKNLAKRAVALKLCQCLHEAGLFIYHQSIKIKAQTGMNFATCILINVFRSSNLLQVNWMIN